MNPEKQRESYAAEVGLEALARQDAYAARLHPCCWEPADGEHHVMCAKRPLDVLPEVHAEQASLL